VWRHSQQGGDSSRHAADNFERYDEETRHFAKRSVTIGGRLTMEGH